MDKTDSLGVDTDECGTEKTKIRLNTLGMLDLRQGTGWTNLAPPNMRGICQYFDNRRFRIADRRARHVVTRHHCKPLGVNIHLSDFHFLILTFCLFG